MTRMEPVKVRSRPLGLVLLTACEGRSGGLARSSGACQASRVACKKWPAGGRWSPRGFFCHRPDHPQSPLWRGCTACERVRGHLASAGAAPRGLITVSLTPSKSGPLQAHMPDRGEHRAIAKRDAMWRKGA